MICSHEDISSNYYIRPFVGWHNLSSRMPNMAKLINYMSGYNFFYCKCTVIAVMILYFFFIKHYVIYPSYTYAEILKNHVRVKLERGDLNLPII